MRFTHLVKSSPASFGYMLLLFVLPFFSSSVILYFTVQHEGDINNFQALHWLVFYLLSCLTMAFALTHTTFIALLSGYFLGWWSFIFIVPAYLFASLIGYLTASKIDHGKLMHILNEKKGVQAIRKNLKESEFKVIFFARLSPVLPFAVMNALLAVLKADLKIYLYAGFAGMLPRTLLFTWTGSQAREIRQLLENPHQDNLVRISFIILLAVSFWGLYYFIRKSFKSADS